MGYEVFNFLIKFLKEKLEYHIVTYFDMLQDANCGDKFSKFICNYDDDSEGCDLYFKECSNTVSFDKRS